MPKPTKIDLLQKELKTAYINKDYKKAKEIQAKIDYIFFGII